MIWLVFAPFAVLALALGLEIYWHQQWLKSWGAMPADEQERLARLWHQ